MSDINDEAVKRARWLAEVGHALAEAQQLTTRLAQWRSGSSEAVLLRVRIMAARSAVEAMQCNRTAPKWSNCTAPRPDQTP